MLRVELGPALLLVVLSVFNRQAETHIRHLGYSPRDQWIECARRVFKKLVVYDPDIPQNVPPSVCGQLSPAELKARLKAQTIAVLEERDAVMLRSSLFLPPCAPTVSVASCIKWRHFRVAISTASAPEGGFNERALSQKQLSQLQDAIVRQARLVPVLQADGEPADIAAATFPIHLQVYVHHLRRDAPPSIVIVVRGDENAAAGRLVYGEEQADGTFKLLWDSSLFVARYLDLSFDDVDGDSFQEIILRASFPAGIHESVALTIFDRTGRELTRQAQCLQPVGFDFWKAHDTCPIVGEALDFIYTDSPPFDIFVRRLFHTDRDGVFRLKGGRYVPQPGR